MKNLLTLVAAIAITSAATAQTKKCSLTTACGTKTYNTTSTISASNNGNTITVKDAATGAVLDTFDCDASTPPVTTTTVDGDTTTRTTSSSSRASFQISCSSSSTPETPANPATPTTPNPTTPSLPDFSFPDFSFPDFFSVPDPAIGTTVTVTRTGTINDNGVITNINETSTTTGEENKDRPDFRTASTSDILSYFENLLKNK